jgi:hypothetical protein
VTFVNLTLDAQQRLASAESDFFRSLVEYSLAVKNVHVEKGTWKSYHSIMLTEDIAAGRMGDGAVVPHRTTGPQPTQPAGPNAAESTESEPGTTILGESASSPSTDSPTGQASTSPPESQALRGGGFEGPPARVPPVEIRRTGPPTRVPSVETRLTSPPAHAEEPAPSFEGAPRGSVNLEGEPLPADLFDSAVESALAG